MERLIVISAPSGAGKTTLCRKLLKDFKNLVLSISFTTRAPRGQEKHGTDYFFVSPEEFKKQIEANRLAEWAQVHGNYYGTSKDFIEASFGQGKSVLLDIDVQGAESLSKAYPKETVKVFISPPSLDELENRLRARGTDSEETIQKRLKNAREEIEKSKHFHHIILNDSLDHAYAVLKKTLEGYLHG
jgi:guanylate kinase